MLPFRPCRRKQLLCLLAAALLAASCASRTPVDAPSIHDEPLPGSDPLQSDPLEGVEPPSYHLRADDLLEISFWGNEELNQSIRVRPDGRISLPFVDEVHAAGLTPAELDTELTRRYASELAEPQITVAVIQIAPQQIFIGGEVGDRGSFPLIPNLSLYQAVQMAGGFLISARRHEVLLIRTYPEDGRRVARQIDLMPLVSGADPTIDVTLQPYDVIFVPRTKITNMSNFVNQYINAFIPIQSVVTAVVLDQVRNQPTN